jgi:hypothetical protein
MKTDCCIWNTGFKGLTSKPPLRDRNFQIELSCMIPPAYQHTQIPRSGRVHVKVLLTDRQVDLQLLGISGGVAGARATFGFDPDARGRVRFHVHNIICGDQVEALSPDYIQDWQEWADKPRQVFDENDDLDTAATANAGPNVAPENKAAILHEVLVLIPQRSTLNPEQLQAYWLFLTSVRAGTLALEGMPGTGKSATIQAIVSALMLMEVPVLLVAQSNTGVDAVFKKIVKDATRHHPEWLNDKMVRLGAKSIEDGLQDQIDKILDVESASEPVRSSIDAEVLPFTVAVKSVRWMNAHRDDPITRSNDLWQEAVARQEAIRSKGKLKKPAGATLGRSQTRNVLFKRAVKPNQVLLVGATAAASHKLRDDYGFTASTVIFDELSQCDEATFMIPVKDQLYTKALLMGGDTKQLGSVIQSANKQPYYNQRALSPLERLIRAYHHRAVVTLFRNYRSHPEIIAAPSKIVYGGRMVSGHAAWPNDIDYAQRVESVLRNDFGNVFNAALDNSHRKGEGRVWWITPRGLSDKPAGQNSTWHQEGASVVVQLAKALRRALEFGDCIKIISMYSLDVMKCEEALVAENGDIEVRTVDSFQGEEAEIVIVHFCAANKPIADPYTF